MIVRELIKMLEKHKGDLDVCVKVYDKNGEAIGIELECIVEVSNPHILVIEPFRRLILK